MRRSYMPRELLFDTASGRFALRDYALPPLEPGQARIRLELAAPKHGTESHHWSGDVNRGRRWDPERRLFLDPPPGPPAAQPPTRAVGNMAVGVVEEVGAETARLQRGDRVYGYMPVREIHCAPASALHVLPDDLPPEAAVCIDPAHVALIAV